MLEFLLKIDHYLLIKINGMHMPWLDTIMMALTNGLWWLPLFLVVIGFMIYKAGWKTVSIFLFLAFVIFLADRISAGLIKPWIARLRPSHAPGLEDMLHYVNGYRGGTYGFVSSHATNAFGVATFLWLTLKRQVPWIWIMFIWAAFFSFTRIYLGVHYPADIIAGGVLGATIGLLVYKIGRLMPEKISPIIND
jgi:undecaprenyl-diphosphatase